MPLPALGLNCNFAMGRETTWGTSVARTKFNEVVRFSGGLRNEKTFGAAFRGIQKRRHFVAKRFAECETTLEAYYEGIEHFFRAIFNTTNPTTGPTNSTAYTHAFVPLAGLIAGYSLEVEKDVQAFLYAGAKCSSARLRWAVDELMTMAIQWYAQNETAVSHTNPTSYPPEKPVLWSQSAVQVDDVAFDCRLVEIDIDNRLNTDRRKLGTTSIKEPARGGRMIVTGRFESDFESINDFYDRYSGDTEFKLAVISTGSTVAASTPAVSEKLTVTLPRCIATGEPIEIQDEGVIKAGLSFEALFQPTGPVDLVTCTITNSVSSVI